jgi:hypothetical protein
MSLKEFNAKQFLLEKGEQVGLGVALTLMVLMLILSLFMPSKGFLSGSPGAKANELNNSTSQLERALTSNQPAEKDLPEKREGKLISLDTAYLLPDNYATQMWFEPRMKEDKSRRPPKIYNVEEAIASVVHIPIDTYMFRFGADPKVLVLQDKNQKGGAGPAAGGNNPFAGFGRQLGGMAMGPGGRGGGGAMLQQQQRLLGGGGLNAINRLQGATEADNMETRWIPLDDWNPQQQVTAHQLVPLRMAVIVGSFPYKQQIEEHKAKLRVKSNDELLNETIGEKDKQTAAFDFREVIVERREVDADGKDLGEWMDPQLKESYQEWLKHTYLPFQEEDHKYDSVKPNDGKGLVMPLLREFRANKQPSAPGLPGGMMPGGMMGGMMMGNMKGGVAPPNAARTNAQPEESKPSSRYQKAEELVGELPKIRETLKKIEEAQPKQIAAAKKFQRTEFLNAFDAQSAIPTDKTQNQNPSVNPQGNASGESYVPDAVLVRVVDVTVKPGKYYRYRFKIRMANPNYKRDDVASPEYKMKETLDSSEWYELPQIVNVPQEAFYYVVDEAQGLRMRDLNQANQYPKESAQYRQLRASAPSPSGEQVAFQFHRWVETTQPSRRETEPIPAGEWAVADRVFVGRGEYIGRKVIVDLPVWKYTQNMFILPTVSDKPNRRAGGKPDTGIEVDFGQDPQENNLILVDFEGGRGQQSPTNAQVKDDCALEVLMLSADGKLLARNSAKDKNNEERTKTRDQALKRIQEVREGKGLEQ